MLSYQRPRTEADRPGKEATVWDWRVIGDHPGEGTAQNQLGARAAIRKFVRALPDAERPGKVPPRLA